MDRMVTVLGGSGFVGTYFCRALSKQGIPFEIVDLKRSRSFPTQTTLGDVRSLDSLLESIKGSIVVNLAAVHRDDVKSKSEYYETNVLGAQNTVRACDILNVRRLIFTSSVAVYGYASPGTDESGPLQPFNEYGRTKMAAEGIYSTWAKEPRNELVIVRPTVIFGEGNRGNVYNLFRYISGRRFVIIGDGLNRKAMAYVRNVGDFLVHCVADRTVSGVINYVDTPTLTMNELVSFARNTLGYGREIPVRLPYRIALGLGYLADLISFLTKQRLTISSLRVRKFCSSSEFSADLARVNFVPSHSLFEAIQETLAYEFINTPDDREIFYTE